MTTKKQTKQMLKVIEGQKEKIKTLKIFGYSVGDKSVGISSCDFEINLGLYPEDVNEGDRAFIVKNILRTIWELHDNGDIKFEFSDEWDKLKDEDKWDFRRRFCYEDAKKIAEEEKE